jgi:hypothetical protein
MRSRGPLQRPQLDRARTSNYPGNEREAETEKLLNDVLSAARSCFWEPGTRRGGTGGIQILYTVLPGDRDTWRAVMTGTSAADREQNPHAEQVTRLQFDCQLGVQTRCLGTSDEYLRDCRTALVF